MRRLSVLLSVVVIMFLAGVAFSLQPVAIAQEATPAAEEMMPDGIAFEPLSVAFGADMTSPFHLLVARFTLAPGAMLPSDERDPSVGIVIVESGTLTVEVDGPVTVTRGIGLGAAFAAAEESGDFTTLTQPVAEGEAVTLEAGDAAYLPGNVAGALRNDGEEPVVMLGFLVLPSEAMAGEVTPAP
jgi:quercetin dioxygenase-like cupin family protein